MYMSHQSFVSILLHQISNIVILIFCLKISFIYSYLYYQFSASSLFKSLVLVKKCMTFYKLMKSINNSITNPVRCNLASVRKICCVTPCLFLDQPIYIDLFSLALWLSVPRRVVDSTDLPSNSNISKAVKVSIVFISTFLKNI